MTRKPEGRTHSKQALRFWLRLLSCEGLVEQSLRTRLRQAFGVTLPQFDVLSELERARRPLTMSELSQQLTVSNGNITGVVDRLVRDGYVQRLASEQDRRVQLIQLTELGWKRFADMAHAHEAWVAELFEDMEAKQLEGLTATLRTLQQSIRSRIQQGEQL